MKAELQGLVIAVTGAGGDVGAKIAEKLAKNGASVFLQDNDLSGAEKTEERIRESGGNAAVLQGNIRDARQVKEMVDEIMIQAGKIDILVNAAETIPEETEKVTVDAYNDELWKDVTETGLLGAYYCTKQVVGKMKEAGEGRVINVASSAGIMGIQKQCASAAAKAGIIGFTRALAAELGASGIRVNAVAPGAVFSGETDNSEKTRELVAHIPLGRRGTPEDVASAVVFLSDPASNYITGTVLTVDGGWTCGFMRDW